MFALLRRDAGVVLAALGLVLLACGEGGTGSEEPGLSSTTVLEGGAVGGEPLSQSRVEPEALSSTENDDDLGLVDVPTLFSCC